MWNKHDPHWIESGEHLGYRWFQSDLDIVGEFTESCPEALLNKWAIMTAFDGESYFPFKQSRGRAKDVWMGEPKPVFGLDDFLWTGNGDEFYIFEAEPAAETLSCLQGDLFFPAKLDLTDQDALEVCWNKIHQLQQINASAYFKISSISVLAISSEQLADRFMQSPFFLNIPKLHIEENKRTLRGWLQMEVTSQPCAKESCTDRRIPYGVNCPRHHFEMLYGIDFPDDLLHD
jgi:hypothetical protein